MRVSNCHFKIVLRPCNTVQPPCSVDHMCLTACKLGAIFPQDHLARNSKMHDTADTSCYLRIQISAAKLTEMDPMAREAAQGMRSALGSDYEQRLRKEAGPAPSRRAKGKHQISSLFHSAKLAVSGWRCSLNRWAAC